MSPEHRDPPSRATNHRAKNKNENGNGGGLGRLLLTLIAIPVCWYASAVAILNVASHFLGVDPSVTATLGLSPTVSFWISVAVLVVLVLALLVIPGTIFWGWLIMGVLTAVGALYVFGWSSTILFLEAQTVVVVVLAMFMHMLQTADEEVVAALALSRGLR